MRLRLNAIAAKKSKNFYEIGEYNDEEAGIQSISAAE